MTARQVLLDEFEVCVWLLLCVWVVVVVVFLGGRCSSQIMWKLQCFYWLTFHQVFFSFPRTLKTCLGELKGLFSIVVLNRLTDLERRQMESGGLIRPLPTRGMPPPGNPVFLVLLNLATSTKTT